MGKRAVKYCGGCNPRYDRAALVKALEDRLGQTLSLAGPGCRYDEVFVVCGCPARCADVSELSAEQMTFLYTPDQIPKE